MKRQEETPLVCPYNLSSSGARTSQPYLPDHPERLGLAAVCFAELLSRPWHVSKPRLACAASQGAAHTPVQTLPCTRQSSFAVQKVHGPDGLCTCGRVQTGAGQRMPGSHGMDRGDASGLRLVTRCSTSVLCVPGGCSRANTRNHTTLWPGWTQAPALPMLSICTGLCAGLCLAAQATQLHDDWPLPAGLHVAPVLPRMPDHEHTGLPVGVLSRGVSLCMSRDCSPTKSSRLLVLALLGRAHLMA